MFADPAAADVIVCAWSNETGWAVKKELAIAAAASLPVEATGGADQLVMGMVSPAGFAFVGLTIISLLLIHQTTAHLHDLGGAGDRVSLE